jgi:hypothetical protein
MDIRKAENEGNKIKSLISNPKDKLTGRFISWEQAKLRSDQDTVIYPISTAGANNSPSADEIVVTTPGQTPALAPHGTGSGLKYGKGPLADRLKSSASSSTPSRKDYPHRTDCRNMVWRRRTKMKQEKWIRPLDP